MRTLAQTEHDQGSDPVALAVLHTVRVQLPSGATVRAVGVCGLPLERVLRGAHGILGAVLEVVSGDGCAVAGLGGLCGKGAVRVLGRAGRPAVIVRRGPSGEPPRGRDHGCLRSTASSTSRRRCEANSRSSIVPSATASTRR